jgi:hypothetical protein
MAMRTGGETRAENLAARQPHLDMVSALHAYALACAGREEEARVHPRTLEWLSRERFVLSSFTPAVYVALGDLDAAISELHTSADARCPWFFQMLADPRLKPLHGHAEFKEMRAILTRIEATAASAFRCVHPAQGKKMGKLRFGPKPVIASQRVAACRITASNAGFGFPLRSKSNG